MMRILSTLHNRMCSVKATLSNGKHACFERVHASGIASHVRQLKLPFRKLLPKAVIRTRTSSSVSHKRPRV